ncbi:unnamed protein product [Cylindrotheca closterium]|uniref:Uncharacterized protein n=1 Tax=Cylindrotheca closterium TaxID=2856 RepID=A0AAD2G3W3_9STRA|nr:unnamed protein product [Cylindrotheca closterium]
MSTRTIQTSAYGGMNRKLRFNGKMKSREIIEWLREAKQERYYTILKFDEVILNSAIIAEVLDLLRISSRHGRVWERVSLEFCEGPVDLVVSSLVLMDCVRHLFLASDKIQDDLMDRLSTALRISTSLKSLWLLIPMTEVSATHLGSAMKYNRSIDKLSLSGSNWENSDDSDSDSDDDTNDGSKSLRPKLFGKQNAGNSPVENQMSPRDAAMSLALGLKYNDGIQSLDISCCDLPDEAMAPIIDGLVGHPYLEALNISRNRCRIQSVEALGRVVEDDDCLIRSLDLREQSPHDALEISPLSFALRQNRSLEALRISHNELVDSQVLELVDSFRGNASIKELDLEHNNITEKGIPDLTKYIKELPSLTKLLLGGNAIGEEGFNFLESLEDDDDSICTITEEDLRPAKPRSTKTAKTSKSTAAAAVSNNVSFLTGIAE